jgi:hypothetical protein
MLELRVALPAGNAPNKVGLQPGGSISEGSAGLTTAFAAALKDDRLAGGLPNKASLVRAMRAPSLWRVGD